MFNYRMCMNGGSTGQPGCVGEDFQQKKCNTQQCSVVSQGKYAKISLYQNNLCTLFYTLK